MPMMMTSTEMVSSVDVFVLAAANLAKGTKSSAEGLTQGTSVRRSDSAAGMPVYTGAVASEPDRADISGVSNVLTAALGTPGSRMARIEALRESIAAGTYYVPASAVAGKIVDTMLISGN